MTFNGTRKWNYLFPLFTSWTSVATHTDRPSHTHRKGQGAAGRQVNFGQGHALSVTCHNHTPGAKCTREDLWPKQVENNFALKTYTVNCQQFFSSQRSFMSLSWQLLYNEYSDQFLFKCQPFCGNASCLRPLKTSNVTINYWNAKLKYLKNTALN